MHKSSLFDARRKWPAAVSGWGDAVYAPLAVDPEIKDSLIKMAWGLALFMVLLVSVLVLFGDEFKALGQAAVNRFGYAGVGIGIALIDMFTLLPTSWAMAFQAPPFLQVTGFLFGTMLFPLPLVESSFQMVTSKPLPFSLVQVRWFLLLVPFGFSRDGFGDEEVV